MISALRRRARQDVAAAPVEEVARQHGVELLRLVAESVTSGTPRQALTVHLSRLPPGLSKPHHLRLARAALDPLAGVDRAQLFELPGMDLVMIWRGDADAALRASRDGIAHLFTGDLLPQPDSLIETLLLPRDARRLCDIAAANLDRALPDRTSRPAGEPLDTAALAALEARLASCDLTSFARRRAVCGNDGDGGLALRWERRVLSVAALSEALLPGRSMRADPWLFRRLTRTLDQRMLTLLAAPGELREAGPFSLDLNVASILAPEFLRFDAALPALLRGHVVIDLLAADVLADPAMFVFARDFARARHYRLLLRGVEAALLPVLPLERLGLDLLELRWRPSLDDDLGNALGDPGRIVLAHADTAAAIAWGRTQRIALFQGAGAMAPAWPAAWLSRNIALGGMASAA